jgi:hypothetical protein
VLEGGDPDALGGGPGALGSCVGCGVPLYAPLGGLGTPLPFSSEQRRICPRAVGGRVGRTTGSTGEVAVKVMGGAAVGVRVTGRG